MSAPSEQATDPLLYSYVKVVTADVLRFQLQNAGLTPLISSMTVNPSLVIIRVTRPLAADEQQLLYAVVANHKSQTVSLDIAKMRIQAAMDFGKSILVEFAANNVVRGINIAQVKDLTAQFGYIQLFLMSGSLYSALDAIQKLQPNALITQADINYYSGKIMDFLGITHHG